MWIASALPVSIEALELPNKLRALGLVVADRSPSLGRLANACCDQRARECPRSVARWRFRIDCFRTVAGQQGALAQAGENDPSAQGGVDKGDHVALPHLAEHDPPTVAGHIHLEHLGHRPLTHRCVIVTTNCQVPPAVVLCSSVRRTDSPSAFLTGSEHAPGAHRSQLRSGCNLLWCYTPL